MNEENIAATLNDLSTKVIHLDKICRTCLMEKDKEHLKTLFDASCLSEMVMSCANVSVVVGDGLPNNICLECLQGVEGVFNFRQQCERSDTTMRQIIEKSVVITQDNEDKYEILNILVTYPNGKLETSAVVVPVESMQLQLFGESNNAESPQEDFNIAASVPDISDSESISQTDLHVKLEEFISKNCDNIDKPELENDDEMIHVDFLKDALTEEYIEIMEKQLGQVIADVNDASASGNLENFQLINVIDDADGKSDNADNKTCELCGKTLRDSRSYKRHLKKHTDVRFECSYCPKRYSERSMLNKHILRHTGEKPHACSICDAKFYESNVLQIHMRRHTGEKPYSCSVCNKTFAQRSLMNTHKKIHNDAKTHICSFCGKGFTLSWQLTAHLRIHTNEKPFECPYCSKRFNQNGNLMIHIRIHTGERPFQCNVCEKAYHSKGELDGHMRQHTGEKKIKKVACSHCGKNFAGNSDLKIHMRTHTGEKPYTCKICFKNFMLRVHLTVHLRSHTGEKPFSCDICGKAFSTNNQLKTHKYMHTGEKNYPCELCDKKFSSTGTRNTHRKNHHENEKAD